MWFSKVRDSARLYGMRATLGRALDRSAKELGLIRSSTLLFHWHAGAGMRCEKATPTSEYSFSLIDEGAVTQYERIKYYDFIDTRRWLQNGSKLMLAWSGLEIAGYGWVHTRPRHFVRGLGVWQLYASEAWLGPDFVRPEYRGYGIHKQLIDARLRFAQQVGLATCFTAVNASNLASIANFERNGFRCFGHISTRRLLGRDINFQVYDHEGSRQIKDRFSR